MVAIAQYILPDCIVFLDSLEKKEAICSLVQILEKNRKVPPVSHFLELIFSREKLASTGIGLGVAVPHAKSDCFNEFFIALGIQQKKGIEWNSIDQSPVRFIFLIGGPENKPTEYLKILSQITHAVKNEQIRKSLLKVKTPEDAALLFQNY